MNTSPHSASGSAIAAPAIAAICAITFAAFAPAQAAQAQGRRPSDVPPGDLATVTRVIDAQTIEVQLNNNAVTVRFAGIDAPVGGACLASQSRAASAALFPAGSLVILERDASVADAVNGLSRHVYALDGRMAGEELLKSGLARRAGESKYASPFSALEALAARERKGGWAKCGWRIPRQLDATGCTMLDVARLMERRATLPELSALAPGECVRISKAQNAETAAWSGVYTWQPKGSRITPGPLYARWQDALLLITRESDGELYANVVRDSYRRLIFPWERASDYDRAPGSTRVTQQRLERDTADAAILRIPNPKTFLFRDNGDGTWTTLTDVFLYREGDARVPRVLPSGNIE
jgi:endonuclease YncB( thermonuclease family)